MKKALYLLAALPLLAGCAHDHMDRSDAMNNDPYMGQTSDRSFDRHSVDRPGDNRQVRGTDGVTDDRTYQRDLQGRPVTDSSAVPATASTIEPMSDDYPDNYSEMEMRNWHRNRWSRGLW